MGMPLFHDDRMTAEERAQAIVEGKPIDRVPFFIIAFGFHALNVGYSIYDWYTDVKKAVEASKWTSEQYGMMWMPFAGYAGIGPWEFGGKIKWPKGEFDQCPSVHPVVNSEEEAWALKMMDYGKLKEAGYTPYYLELARIAQEYGIPFQLPMYGPWTTAGNIVNIELLSRWVIKKPDLAHHVLRVATDFLVMFNQIIADEVGPQSYMPGNSTASAANDLISPKTFKEFVLPYLIEYHRKLIEMGVTSIFFHLCGEQNANYAFYPQVPLPPESQISVSHEVDLDKASATFPDYIITGNIEPALLQLGTPQQVYEACRAAIEKGKKHKRGFILATGCEMPPQTPPYNVWMMAKAVNDFGYYN
jgi:uroporphyrinogen decarboxylase